MAAPPLFDMARQAVTGTPGTGPITLGSVIPGYQSFTAAGVTDGTVVTYGIKDAANAWEVGRAAFSGGVLSRGPLYSSNANAAIACTSAAQVYLTLLAEDLAALNVDLYAAGNTAGSTTSEVVAGAITFSGANGVSLGFSNSTLIVSGAATSIQTATFQAIGNTTASTSATTGSLTGFTLSGAGNVSLGYSGNTIVISGSAAAVAGTGNQVAVGNTTGSTSSQSTSLSQLTFSAAGGMSIGFSNSSIILSAPTTAAETGNWSALGNTTGSTSSTSASVSQFLTISGSGAVSVGFSGKTLIIAGAATAAATQTATLVAIGNTTASTSATSASLTGLTFSGAGGVSVGFTGSTVVISGPSTAAQTAETGNWTALGNTTGSTSSTSASVSQFLTISGSGGVSVGFSGKTLIIAGLTTAAQTNQTANFAAVGNTTGATSSTNLTLTNLSFVGGGIVSVGFNGSSVQVSATVPGGGTTVSYLENGPLLVTQTINYRGNVNNMLVGSAEVAVPVTFNMVRYLVSVNLGQLGTSTTSTTSTSTSGSNSTGLTVVLYSAAGGNSSNTFTSYTSASVSFAISQIMSLSGASQTHSVNISYPVSSTTSSFSTSISSTTTFNMSTGTNLSNAFFSLRELDVYFAGGASAPAGDLLVGASLSVAGAGWVALTNNTTAAFFSFMGNSGVTANMSAFGAGAGVTTQFQPGVGLYSTTAGGSAPPSFDWRSAQSTSAVSKYFQLIAAN